MRGLSSDLDEIFRKISAVIIFESSRRRKVTLGKLMKFLDRNIMNIDELVSELQERFRRVGLILKFVPESNLDENTEVVAVVDPSLDLDYSAVDGISAAILAIVYLKGGERGVSLAEIYEVLSHLMGDEESAKRIVNRSLRLLENKGFLNWDQKTNIVKLTTLGVAVLPSKSELEDIILRYIETNADLGDRLHE